MDAPGPTSTVEGLEAFVGRGAGTDAERRAAVWLRDHAAEGDAVLETFWCRPNWALAHTWHVALAVAGSLISLASPIAGIVILSIALVSVIADALTGASLGRWLTLERASQNVIVTRRDHRWGEQTPPPTRLIVTANYDTGRRALAYRLKPVTTRVTTALRGFTPGWLGWLVIAIVWLLAVAVLRQTSHTSSGHTPEWIGAVQLAPTVGLVLSFALLVDLATGQWSPGGGDNATGVAVALDLASALKTAPPEHFELTVVLAGAGDGEQVGLRSFLRAQRRHDQPARRTHGRPHETIVLGVAASGDGSPRWWQSDGPFVALRYGAALRRIAERVARDEPHLGASPHRGRGNTGAFPARVAGLPALTIGCLDQRGVPPRSHQKTDSSAAVDAQAVDRAVQFALLVIDGIDAAVGEGQGPPGPTQA